ncbi:hypothetical protein F4781DRAFT_58038 [Annulohypoxylon bovei var. microspora]|nr:hypothetical protein F4781DRAFT_58038 [Annulohypoxylon bovei var. microspora]
MSTTIVFPPPINPNDPGRGPLVIGVTWTFTGLAIITTLLRLYVRKHIGPRLATDDWLMVIAMIFQLVAQIFVSLAFKHGMGKHVYDLYTSDQVVTMSMWEWFSVPPGVVSGIFGRISICILLIRLFGVRVWFRYYAIALTACGVITSTITGICLYASRQPVQSLWNPYIPNPKQWEPTIVPDMMFLGQSFYALADLTFVIFPIIIVSNLHMSLSRRLSLIAMMTLSLFTCGMSIMKGVSAIAKQQGSDGTYTGPLSLLWATLEQACVVLLGNIVPLRALLKLEIPTKLSTFVNSMASLLGQSTRADSKSSALSETAGYRNGAYHDIEMNTHGLGNESNAVWHEVKGQDSYSNNSTRIDGQVKRTDSFTVAYAEPGGLANNSANTYLPR